MKTLHTRSVARAAEFIRQGEVVAFPTETVYGLGANIFDERAIRKIFKAKRRPADNPLIAHIATVTQTAAVARRIPASARKLIAAFFPGPLTLVLPKREKIPALATAGLDTVGVRMPRHAVALRLIRACGVPLAAPSANRSGRPSPTTWRAVRQDMDGRIACILMGSPTEIGLESTVVDCTGRVPLVLRTGAITLEQLRRVIPSTRRAAIRAGQTPKSPGLKHRHYSPRARVFLVKHPPAAPPNGSAFIGLVRPKAHVFKRTLVCRDVAHYARVLFHFFRQCDAAGVRNIYCQITPERGLGHALMDRLRRASQNHSP